MTEGFRETPRLVLTACIVGYFGYALVHHYSTGNEETLKNAFMIAVGFWLGSSKGSSEKNDQLLASLAASNEPTDVNVVNPPSDPANVTETKP